MLTTYVDIAVAAFGDKFVTMFSKAYCERVEPDMRPNTVLQFVKQNYERCLLYSVGTSPKNHLTGEFRSDPF
jgi:hypothetical protein